MSPSDHCHGQIIALLGMTDKKCAVVSHDIFHCFKLANNTFVACGNSWVTDIVYIEIVKILCKHLFKLSIWAKFIKIQVLFVTFFKNLGCEGPADTIFTNSWWCSSNIQWLYSHHDASSLPERLSCSLKVASVDCCAQFNTQHDVSFCQSPTGSWLYWMLELIELKAENRPFKTGKRFLREYKFKWTTPGAESKRTCPWKPPSSLSNKCVFYAFLFNRIACGSPPQSKFPCQSLLIILEISPLPLGHLAPFAAAPKWKWATLQYMYCSCDFFIWRQPHPYHPNTKNIPPFLNVTINRVRCSVIFS